MCSLSVMVNSLWPHGLQPTRLLYPWSFPQKNTGVGCHFLLQGIFHLMPLNCTLKMIKMVILYNTNIFTLYSDVEETNKQNNLESKKVTMGVGDWPLDSERHIPPLSLPRVPSDQADSSSGSPGRKRMGPRVSIWQPDTLLFSFVTAAVTFYINKYIKT